MKKLPLGIRFRIWGKIMRWLIHTYSFPLGHSSGKTNLNIIFLDITDIFTCTEMKVMFSPSVERVFAFWSVYLDSRPGCQDQNRSQILQRLISSFYREKAEPQRDMTASKMTSSSSGYNPQIKDTLEGIHTQTCHLKLSLLLCCSCGNSYCGPKILIWF